MSDDNAGRIHQQITELVHTERNLREQLRAGEISLDEEHQKLRAVEEALDQCWDLLRQREALKSVGKNPDDATVRPVEQVEGYR